jgi:RND family efflux transporter MFP subunit
MTMIRTAPRVSSRWWTPQVALLAALLGTSCHEPPAKPTPAAQLPTVTVVARQVQIARHQAAEEVVGTVRAKVRATVEAKVSGRIARMPVRLGQRVKAGQLLARIHAGEISAKLAQAQAVLAQTKGDLARYSALVAQQAATRQEFEAVQTRHRVALANVQEARTMLGYATVKAPFSGVITRKAADVGDLAAPGKPLLELEDPSSLRLEVDVPAGLIGTIEEADKLPVRLDNAEKMIDGVVTEIAPSADPNSRTSVVKIDLQASTKMRIGQFGRARIPTAATKLLRVPAAAVLVRGQMELVFVAEKGRAQLRLVKTGKRLGRQVELVSGVEEGEQVVVEGALKLRDGQRVEVKR